MLLDLTKNNNDITVSQLHNYIKNNIVRIMKDPDIKELLDPNNNSVTREYLNKYSCHSNNDNDNNDAYVQSYLFTIVSLLQVSGIYLKE